MGERKRLTEAGVKAAKKAERRQEIPDATLPGFYLIVQKSGAKSYAIRYRGAGGQHRKYTIGSAAKLELARARDIARKAFDAISRGEDPALVRREKKVAETVGEAFAEFLERYAMRNRSWRETERIFEREILPAWRNRKLVDLRRRDVIRLLDPIADRAPTMANRTLAAVRRFLNWCVERDLLDVSPALGVKAPTPESKRDRVLSPAELKALWRALEVEDWPFRQWGQLLILTAQRKTEVAEMQWPEIDLGEGIWTIAAERAKNGVEHAVPLAPMTKQIVKTLPRMGEGELVFPAMFRRAGADDDEARSFSGFSRLKARLDERMAAELKVKAVPRWTFHDVRRTAATTMAGLGVPPHVVEKLLNHVSGTFSGVAGVYNRFAYRAEKADALARWEAWIERLLAEADNVVPMRREGA